MTAAAGPGGGWRAEWTEELRDLPDALHVTAAMAEIFSGRGRVRRMLAFEAALARAQARVGLVPEHVADAIGTAAAGAEADIPAMARSGAVAGTIALPVVRLLRGLVDEEARRYVHYGATSQDVIDTATMLQVRDGLDVLSVDLLAAGEACARLCERHRHTVMAGRTLLQQAVPITFGLKAAQWLSGITRQLAGLRALRATAVVLQFGGAAGTLASHGARGLAVSEHLADALDVGLPDVPWHTERSRVAEIAAALGITGGVMAKIATDLVLLAQSEVGEASEAGSVGKGRSSTMPHKRNPTDTMAVLASQRLLEGHVGAVLGAMAQEHERAVGGWQAEWTALPAAFRLAGSQVARTRSVLEHLQVDPERMRANLERARGLPMAEALAAALAPALGHEEAHHLVDAACDLALAEGLSLHEAAAADERIGRHLDEERIAAALDPLRYLGSADDFIDRALARLDALRRERPEASQQDPDDERKDGP